jgi:hypothetical protein
MRRTEMKDLFIAVIGTPIMFLFSLLLWSKIVWSFPDHPFLAIIIGFYPMFYFFYLIMKKTKVCFTDYIGLGLFFTILFWPIKKIR